ncbi:MAG: hypothetical protein COB36_08070 [Alphaproteobacteria bacterium]|nr:MAG: hypothetical protein COB36_08070 [Alphaproteobacteria bacterium]
MGSIYYFEEKINGSPLAVEVLSHSNSLMLKVGKENPIQEGNIIEFSDLEQLDRFVEAINDVHTRLYKP